MRDPNWAEAEDVTHDPAGWVGRWDAPDADEGPPTLGCALAVLGGLVLWIGIMVVVCAVLT